MSIKKIRAKSPNRNLSRPAGNATFARLADINELVDQINNTSSSSGTYKSYVAKIFQNSTSNPVVTEIYNDTGLTLNWTRAAAGRYVTNTTTGDTSKITITCSPGNLNPVGICIYSSIQGAGGSNIYFQVESFANYTGAYIGSVGPNDSILINATIEIRIYN